MTESTATRYAMFKGKACRQRHRRLPDCTPQRSAVITGDYKDARKNGRAANPLR